MRRSCVIAEMPMSGSTPVIRRVRSLVRQQRRLARDFQLHTPILPSSPRVCVVDMSPSTLVNDENRPPPVVKYDKPTAFVSPISPVRSRSARSRGPASAAWRSRPVTWARPASSARPPAARCRPSSVLVAFERR